MYFAKFGISEFSMLRARYLTTGFAFICFTFLPFLTLILPVATIYYLRDLHRIYSIISSFFAFIIVVLIEYSVLCYVIYFRSPIKSIVEPFSLYAVEFTKVISILKWITPIILVFFIYIPLVALYIVWRVGKTQKIMMVICIPVILFGTGIVFTLFALCHYPKLRPAFGGPTAMICNIVVTATTCQYLGVEVLKNREICTLQQYELLHNTNDYIYVRQNTVNSTLQIPLSEVKLIAPATL
jgi:hypothetical protein